MSSVKGGFISHFDIPITWNLYKIRTDVRDDFQKRIVFHGRSHFSRSSFHKINSPIKKIIRNRVACMRLLSHSPFWIGVNFFGLTVTSSTFCLNKTPEQSQFCIGNTSLAGVVNFSQCFFGFYMHIHSYLHRPFSKAW